jgi:hypothetical protein
MSYGWHWCSGPCKHAAQRMPGPTPHPSRLVAPPRSDEYLRWLAYNGYPVALADEIITGAKTSDRNFRNIASILDYGA